MAMRVALTCNFSPWSAYSGGGQRSTHALATALAGAGHEVHVVFTRPPWEHFEVPAVDYTLHWGAFFGLRSRRAAPLRPMNALSVARVVKKLHAERALDVVHGNGEEVVLVAKWAQRQGLAVVTTPRYPNYPAPLLAEGGPGPLQRLQLAVTDPKYLLLGQAVRASTWCCPTSEAAARQVERALRAPRERIRVVPNGVAPAFFERKWSPEPDAPILFFGRLERDKGLDVLLRALARHEPTLRLLVVGRGDEGDDLRQLAGELGLGERVDWCDWLDETELARELGRCKMAVLPSRHESFGNAMAETMAAGAPLITTTAGSIPEIVEHEASGLMVKVDDIDALAAAIQRLVDDTALARQLGATGRERMSARFSWQAIALRYIELYRTRPREFG